MTSAVGNLTPGTLIDRLENPEDHEAWQVFYRLYGPLILSFCQGHGCEPQLAEEVLQEVMVCLLKKMSRFSYNRQKGSFRGYLRRVTRSRLYDAFRRQKRKVFLCAESADPDAIAAQMLTVPTLDWDQHWKQMVLRQALERARMKVTEKTYESFRMHVLEDKPVKVVADSLNLTRNTVYQHKRRVMKLVQHEATMLTVELGEEIYQ